MAHSSRTRARNRDDAPDAGERYLPGTFWEEMLRYTDLCEDHESERRLSSDLERLQGAWTTESGPRQVELLISGQHLTAHFGDGEIYMGSFRLGSAGRLTTLDVHIDEGPLKHRGQTVLCICELNGDTMHWCNASPGHAERPSVFDDQNSHLLCLMLRREHRT